MLPIQSNANRGKYLLKVSYVLLGLYSLFLLDQIFHINTPMQTQTYKVNSFSEIDLEYYQSVLILLFLGTYVATAVFFLRWFSRAYTNLHVLTKPLNYSKSSAVWSWFVPIYNLFRPYQIMKELYFQSQMLLQRNKVGYHSNLSTKLVTNWWVLWLGFTFGYDSISRLITTNIDPLNHLMLNLVSFVLNCMGVVLIVMFIKVIVNYQKVEPLLEKLATKSPETQLDPKVISQDLKG